MSVEVSPDAPRGGADHSAFAIRGQARDAPRARRDPRRHRQLRRAHGGREYEARQGDGSGDHFPSSGERRPEDRADDDPGRLVRLPAPEPRPAHRLCRRALDRPPPARGGLPAGRLGDRAPVDDRQSIHATPAPGCRQAPPGRRRPARRFELPERARADVRGRLRLDGDHGRPPDQAAIAPTTLRGGPDDRRRRGRPEPSLSRTPLAE